MGSILKGKDATDDGHFLVKKRRYKVITAPTTSRFIMNLMDIA